MKINRYQLGQLQANCYFIIQDKQCIVVDPADEADFILEKISREGLKLVGMIATHGHFDHIMAAGEIQLSFDAPLYISEADTFLIKRLNETANYFLGFDPHALPPSNIQKLDGGKLKVDRFEFTVIETPGHTPGSCCLYFKEEGIIFTGDTLFKDGVGRYDFSYSSKSLLDKSLETLFQLPQDITIYPGHGDEVIIGEITDTLSFLN